MAQARTLPPPDAQPGAERIVLLCSVTDQDLSSNCRFLRAIIDRQERLKAGTELGFLDAHPFPIPGAVPGAEVKVLVRLKVSPGGKGVVVAAPEGVFRASSGEEISDPLWVVSPHDPWTNGFIPEMSARPKQKGHATVRCVATEIGTLVNCWVQEETPAGFGFGEASLLILQHARMQPVSAGGAFVAGRPYVQTCTVDGTYAIPRE